MRADRSGPLRHGVRREIEEQKPRVELPAIAVITQFIAKRPVWAARQPFPVPSEIYEAGEKEMRDHMKKRGFPLPTSKELENDGVRNFMLLGTPVVEDH